jgi:acyl-CoA synthetase (AMP-forming)/AMP-acid ligase II
MEQPTPPSTFPALFAQVVAANGAKDAVVTTAETLSYDELDRRSARLGCALLAIGAGKGSRIALMAPDGTLWITAFVACLRIGALVTTVSTLCTPPELAHILRNSDIQIFIGVRGFLRHDYAETLSAALPGLDEGEAEELRLVAAPHLRSIWLDDANGLGWARSIDELMARADGENAPAAAFLSDIEKEVAPSDDAVIVYTSGSTSLPKAVVHSQRTIARHPQELAKYFLIKNSDRMMPTLPAFWLGGMAMALEVLSQGATLVYPDTPATEDVLEAIERHKVDRLNGWGDMLVKLREAAVARGIDVDRIVGLGVFRDERGELIPPALQVNMLGMSETFAAHSAERLDFRMPDDKAGSSGRAIGGYERRVVDPDTGKTVPVGEVGELQIRGGGLMTGFYKVERHKVFTPDGFYPTGDLVRIDADDYLYFVARRGDMIKTKAANVSRLEVEAAMRELPEVDLPLVVGLPDPEFGQMVAAAVVPRPGTSPSADSIRTALRARLSSYKVPRRIVFIRHEDVPRTATGKLKLGELGNLIASRIGTSEEAAVRHSV